MSLIRTLIASVLSIAAAGTAHAVNVDFDAGTAGVSVGTISPGVTFTNAEYTSNLGLTGSSGSLGIRVPGTYQWFSSNPISISFAGGISSFSIGIVDLGANGFTVQAYDGSNQLIGSDTKFGLDVGIGNYDTVSFSAAYIGSVQLFQAQNVNGDGVLLDNMTYQPLAVPEPGEASLMMLGLAGLAWMGRRRKA